MREHCAHARFVWNLAVEQQSWWRRGRPGAPGYLEQCRQLTAARAESDWLRAGSQTVQQQGLRDFGQAVRGFFAGTHRKPGFRKASRSNGFRITGPQAQRVRRLNRRHGQVWCLRPGGSGSAGPAPCPMPGPTG
jgi:putative transposase